MKHLVVAAAEAAQIRARAAIEGEEWLTGVAASPEERLAHQFKELAGPGIRELIETGEAARSWYRRLLQSNEWISRFSDPSYVAEVERKDAAFYVDLTTTGEVQTPSRVAGHATTQIMELAWFLNQYGALQLVLRDDAAWERFTRLVDLKPRGEVPPRR